MDGWIDSICLSGNTFTNYAFYSEIDITSCARPELVNCAGNSVNCISQMYGDIDTDYFDQIGTFIVDDETVPYVFQVAGNVALDNIRFNVSSEIESNPSMFSENGNILIVDSFIQNVE